MSQTPTTRCRASESRHCAIPKLRQISALGPRPSGPTARPEQVLTREALRENAASCRPGRLSATDAQMDLQRSSPPGNNRSGTKVTGDLTGPVGFELELVQIRD